VAAVSELHSAVAATSGAPAASGEKLAVEVCGLQYRFADGTHALRGVTCKIARGASIGLIGPNGAGKSTLLLHLNGLLPADAPATRSSGEVIICGKSLRGATPKELLDVRRLVGLVFQDPNDQLFCPTVYEDIAFGPEQLGLSGREVRERVEKSLGMMKLEGFEKRLPQHLSVGEKRRVCVAGVLACEPQVLVLDEPTSNLDPRGRRELKALLTSIPITKIIATHDLEMVAEICPEAILLAKGQVAAQGRSVDMLSDKDLMEKHDLERPHILWHQHPHLPQISRG
jgi:cobalt/nickel transport system ATP-binding protein